MPSSLRSLYVQNEVLHASPERLVQILYELGIRAIAAARECLTERDVLGRVRHINKAFAVLAELQHGLDFEAGGEVARNYAGIYDYCQRRILEANQKQSARILEEVQALLEDLNESWQVVVTHMSKERHQMLYSAEPPVNGQEFAGSLCCVG